MQVLTWQLPDLREFGQMHHSFCLRVWEAFTAGDNHAVVGKHQGVLQLTDVHLGYDVASIQELVQVRVTRTNYGTMVICRIFQRQSGQVQPSDEGGK